jgi:hypothetical protein
MIAVGGVNQVEMREAVVLVGLLQRQRQGSAGSGGFAGCRTGVNGGRCQPTRRGSLRLARHRRAAMAQPGAVLSLLPRSFTVGLARVFESA